MHWKFIKETLALFTLFISVSCIDIALADTIFLKNKVLHGKVVKIENNTVHYQAGCDNQDTTSANLDEIDSIQLSGKCEDKKAAWALRIFGSGLSVKCNEPQKIIKVGFKSRSGKLIAYIRSITLDDATASIELVESGLVYKGPRTAIANIKSLNICGEGTHMENDLPIPQTFTLQKIR